jgi:hypothetical protein
MKIKLANLLSHATRVLGSLRKINPFISLSLRERAAVHPLVLELLITLTTYYSKFILLFTSVFMAVKPLEYSVTEMSINYQRKNKLPR